MSVLDSYKIVAIVRNKNKQKRNGAPATGRTLVIQITYEISYSYAGKVLFQNEYENDWTTKYSDKELIGMEY